MSGDPEFVVLRYSAWLDTEKFESKILGAVVRHFLRPTNDYVPESPLRYNVTSEGEPQELDEGTLDDFIYGNMSGKSIDASAALQSIAKFTWKGSTEDSVHLKGRLIRWKRLQHISGNYWPRLKDDEAVCKTVPGWISIYNSWPPCLVVGIMIAEDVELDFSDSKNREIGGQVEVPLAAALAEAPIDVPVGNPQGEVVGTKSSQRGFEAKTTRSQIFALELRTVTTSLFKSRLLMKESGPKVDTGRLAGHGQLSDEDEDENVKAEDMILESFTEADYKQM